MDKSVPLRRQELVLIDKKKRTYHLVDSPVPADHREIIKESEKINRYLDLAREIKKKAVENKCDNDTYYSWCACERSPEEMEFREIIKTIESTVLLRSSRTLRKVLRTWRDFLSS